MVVMNCEKAFVGSQTRHFACHHGVSLGYPLLFYGNSGAMESCQAFVRTLELCPMDIRAQLVQNVVICGGLTGAILSVGPPILTNTHMGIWVCLKIGYLPNEIAI